MMTAKVLPFPHRHGLPLSACSECWYRAHSLEKESTAGLFRPDDGMAVSREQDLRYASAPASLLYGDPGDWNADGSTSMRGVETAFVRRIHLTSIQRRHHSAFSCRRCSVVRWPRRLGTSVADARGSPGDAKLRQSTAQLRVQQITFRLQPGDGAGCGCDPTV